MSDIDDIVRRHVHGTTDPAENLGAFISENSAIVRELAERGPFIDDDQFGYGGRYCADCRIDERGEVALGDPQHHDPSCLWRRAKELYP